jgi:hypothetical protein
VRGRKDLVWIDHRGVAHGLREYEPRTLGRARSGTTWCGRALNLAVHDLRRAPATCMTCLVAAGR